MGNRDGIDEMSSTNSSVLLSVLKLIDKYDLYGQVAYPKHHKQSDVPDIYRLAAKTKVTPLPPSLLPLILIRHYLSCVNAFCLYMCCNIKMCFLQIVLYFKRLICFTY